MPKSRSSAAKRQTGSRYSRSRPRASQRRSGASSRRSARRAHVPRFCLQEERVQCDQDEEKVQKMFEDKILTKDLASIKPEDMKDIYQQLLAAKELAKEKCALKTKQCGLGDNKDYIATYYHLAQMQKQAEEEAKQKSLQNMAKAVSHVERHFDKVLHEILKEQAKGGAAGASVKAAVDAIVDKVVDELPKLKQQFAGAL